MTVKSLSQMMRPGTLLAGSDCETCGPAGSAKVVTKVAAQNMAKINQSIKKAAQPVQVTVEDFEVEVIERAKPSLLSPNKPAPAQIAAKKPINEY